MNRVYNFSAGPATIPTEVLEKAQKELLDWHGVGTSVMEMSHRSKEFVAVAEKAEADFRKLLSIPDNYKVLFMQGGGRGQFSMVPMNLLRGKKVADYLDCGIWSIAAINEAKRYCDVNVVASAESSQYTELPSQETWQLNKDAAYLHIVDNETVNGLEFPNTPEVDVPLVADMSSNILSKPFDITKYGCVYAGAQKNIGPSGITLAVVREDLLGGAIPQTPTLYNYKTFADSDSMYNTPPTFAWYLSGLVFEWLLEKGGVAEIAKVNDRKAKKLYECIDNSDFYHNTINPVYRSRMNAIFTLADDGLNDTFLTQAKESGLVALKGHRKIGGMRASIYNAMPEEGVDALISFMQSFEQTHG